MCVCVCVCTDTHTESDNGEETDDLYTTSPMPPLFLCSIKNAIICSSAQHSIHCSTKEKHGCEVPGVLASQKASSELFWARLEPSLRRSGVPEQASGAAA